MLETNTLKFCVKMSKVKVTVSVPCKLHGCVAALFTRKRCRAVFNFSANCEWGFSLMNAVKTKPRNHL